TRRPSEAWLNNPGWMDGGHDPPMLYFSHEQINNPLIAVGRPPRPYVEGNAIAQAQYDMQAARVSPSPAPADPPAPVTPVLTNITNSHYRTENGALSFFFSFFLDSCSNYCIAGHLVNVTLFYTPTQPAISRNKAIPKKAKITKMDTISMGSISRVEFIKAFLKIHGLHETFSPGTHSGPDFKLWWTGASGGKSGAPSIQNDHQFGVALEALQKKDWRNVQVGVEIDVDDMEGFRIKQIVPPGVNDSQVGGEEELAYGTQVPQVEAFSELTQLHGHFILELKKKWPCQQHFGEHGQTGYCYVSAASKHIMLNPLRLKTWAAAMAAGDATKHEPPHAPAFDGAHDGNVVGPRSRGRTGPHPAMAPSSDVNRDAMALLMMSLVPVLTGMSQKNSRKRSHSMSSPPTTPKRFKSSASTESPLPEKEFELRKCLRDLAELEGIDWTPFEIEMRMEDYTPDIIPFVSDTELRRISGAPNSAVLKAKKFCKEWSACLEKK
ncbi:hypothetical protein BJ165DRAFT_1328515, partial [Panaeolus papilionaceus]